MPDRVQRQRIELTNEWHARPRLELPEFFRCTHIVEMNTSRGLQQSREDFTHFCQRFQLAIPSEGARFHAVSAGNVRVKWEGHSECSSRTLIVPGNGEPLFSETAVDFLPEAERDRLLDRMFVGVQVEVIHPREEDPTGRELAKSVLGVNEVYGGWMSARTAIVWSAFRLDARGFVRMLVVSQPGHAERRSRLLQRLLDLESYRMLAMLGLSRARSVMASLTQLEPELDSVMKRLAEDRNSVDEKGSLQLITSVAAKVEHIAAENAYRFAASQAYGRIIERRSEEVNEEVLDDNQRYTQFLSRSLQPALRTCESAERRIEGLAARVGRAAGLLDTMVDVSQKQQNQEILESLASSARTQVKLQEAVEGFSIVAISYYGVGLLSYALKSMKASGVKLDPALLTGLAAPIVLICVWLTVRKVRKKAASAPE